MRSFILAYAARAGLLLAFIAGTAAAVHAQEPQMQMGKPDKNDPEAVTCKRQVIVGSRIPSKICQTNAQWEEQRRRIRENANSGTRPAIACPETGRC